MQPTLSRRSLLASTGVLAISPALAGCQSAAPAAVSSAARFVVNPAVAEWFSTLTATVGANFLTDLSKQGVQQTLDEWSPGLWSLIKLWFPDAKEKACVTGFSGDVDGRPGFIMARVSDQGTCEGLDPLTDFAVWGSTKVKKVSFFPLGLGKP